MDEPFFNEVTMSVRTCSFVHVILLWTLFTNKSQFDAGFYERLKLKDDDVPNTLDPTVMSQHTIVSKCFHYVITIALSVITDCLIRVCMHF